MELLEDNDPVQAYQAVLPVLAVNQADQADQVVQVQPIPITDRNDGDDPCIGHRTRRTWIIASLLIVFFALGLPLFARQFIELSKKPQLSGIISIFIFIASCIIIISAALLIIFFVRPFGDKCAKWICIFVIIAGVFHFFACIAFTVARAENKNIHKS